MARQHESVLLRSARRMCRRNEDLAQDLVQDTLIKGYEAFLGGKFSAGTNEKAWLLRILTNNYINDYRRKQRWESGVDIDNLANFELPGVESEQVSKLGVPGQVLLEDTLDENIEKALNSLSEVLRCCIILVDIKDMNYEEAAFVLNVPVGTVRSRLSRARASLFVLLESYAGERRMIP